MVDAFAVEHHIDGERSTHPVDAAIAAIAARQHGVIARIQLLRLGLGRGAIELRVRRGRLHVIHRGVYAVRYARLTIHGRWMAAVLASGEETRLTFRSAGMLWGIRRTERGLIEVTSPHRGRGRPGIQRHRAVLLPDEVTIHHGIPTTTVPTTLLDLASVLTPHQLARAVNEAEVQRLTDPLSLNALLERYPRRPGVPALRALLGQHIAVTKSELEKRFREFLIQNGLPLPETNAHVEVEGVWYEVDCLWRAERVVVELDGRAIHDTKQAFETDRARDRILQAAGYRVIRITWRQLHESPAAVAADLRALLRLGRTTAG
jgi:predicted transcriptional regulator of viral defense system